MKLTVKELIFDTEHAPCPSHHASTLAMLPDGEVIAAWFGGTHENDPDVEIWCSVRKKDGRWTAPVMVSDKSGTACWNPVLIAEGDGARIFYKRGVDVPDWNTWTRHLTFADGKLVLSEERELVPGDVSGGRGPVKNKPIFLSDGTLLAGASHEYHDGKWLAFADRSTDGGKTWERTDYLAAEEGVNLIQPTLWEDATHGVHMLLRSNQGVIFRADSADMGKTWSPARRTTLSNNNSGIDLVKMPDGRLALVCNPVSGNWAKRTPISLFLSSDNGDTWEKELDLETADGEFSYPAVIWDGEKLRCTFTYDRRSVMYCEITVSKD